MLLSDCGKDFWSYRGVTDDLIVIDYKFVPFYTERRYKRTNMMYVTQKGQSTLQEKKR